MAMGGIFLRAGDIQQALGIIERALGLDLIGNGSGTNKSLTLAGR